MVNGTSRPSQCRSKQQLDNMTPGSARSDKSVESTTWSSRPATSAAPCQVKLAPPAGRASIPVTPEAKP